MNGFMSLVPVRRETAGNSNARVNFHHRYTMMLCGPLDHVDVSPTQTLVQTSANGSTTVLSQTIVLSTSQATHVPPVMPPGSIVEISASATDKSVSAKSSHAIIEQIQAQLHAHVRGLSENLGASTPATASLYSSTASLFTEGQDEIDEHDVADATLASEFSTIARCLSDKHTQHLKDFLTQATASGPSKRSTALI
jgi:hypothetical protein